MQRQLLARTQLKSLPYEKLRKDQLLKHLDTKRVKTTLELVPILNRLQLIPSTNRLAREENGRKRRVSTRNLCQNPLDIISICYCFVIERSAVEKREDMAIGRERVKGDE